MVRQMCRGALALVLIATVLETARSQPAANADRIYYRDKKTKDGSVASIDGVLKTSPAGYQIVSGAKVIPVSPADIVRVVPGELPGLDRKDVLAQATLEANGDWEKARVGYVEMQKKAANAQDKARRFLEFKVATATAKAADDTPEESGWKEKAGGAVTLLSDFLSAYPSGWEVWPTARTCARLQSELGAYDNAARTWAKLIKNQEVPADLRAEATFQEIDTLIRGKRYPDAASRISDAQKTATAGAQKDRLAIYQLAAKYADNPADGVAPIEAEIAKAKDPGTKAVGYGMLGELYLLANKPREAMWALLWVEVVYNQNPDEVAKALVRLTQVFKLQGDEERTKAYQDKLRRYRSQL